MFNLIFITNIIIIIITIFIKSWLLQEGKILSAYKVLNWEVRDKETRTSKPQKAQPRLTAFFLHDYFSCSPPIHSHKSFLKHPTHLQIKAIAGMAEVQAQAGRIKESRPLSFSYTQSTCHPFGNQWLRCNSPARWQLVGFGKVHKASTFSLPATQGTKGKVLMQHLFTP